MEKEEVKLSLFIEFINKVETLMGLSENLLQPLCVYQDWRIQSPYVNIVFLYTSNITWFQDFF